LMLVGGVVGEIIGFNWVPREAATINRAPRPPQRWISEDRQSLETQWPTNEGGVVDQYCLPHPPV
jgi:hypothetical protein